MENLKSSKVIAVMTTALLVASLVWLMNTNRVNNSLETGLQEQKLKSEGLLSEKLLLEKDIEKFKGQLFKLKDENADLDGIVKSITAKLKNQESEYIRMKRDNASLGQIKKQRQELQVLKNELENELTSIKASYAALEAKNRELNTSVAALQERNKMLSDDLNRATLAAVDQSQIQAVRGKSEKLTVKAKRTKKLIANFEVPANLRNLSFRIIDMKGNALTPQQGNIAFTSAPSEKSLTASTDSDIEGSKLQKVEMVYIPKQKLNTGVYSVEILNENLYVGSLKVKLQ
jgi:hypothetical protein